MTDPEIDRAWRAEMLRVGISETEGWIDDLGNFWPVGYHETHADIAQLLLGEDGEAEADRRGWLRISDHGDRCARKPNQRQLDRWFDYCEHWSEDFKTARRRLHVFLP